MPNSNCTIMDLAHQSTHLKNTIKNCTVSHKWSMKLFILGMTTNFHVSKLSRFSVKFSTMNAIVLLKSCDIIN